MQQMIMIRIKNENYNTNTCNSKFKTKQKIRKNRYVLNFHCHKRQEAESEFGKVTIICKDNIRINHIDSRNLSSLSIF